MDFVIKLVIMFGAWWGISACGLGFYSLWLWSLGRRHQLAQLPCAAVSGQGWRWLPRRARPALQGEINPCTHAVPCAHVWADDWCAPTPSCTCQACTCSCACCIGPVLGHNL